MALADEIKSGLAVFKDLQAQAKDKKDDIEKAAAQLESLAAVLKGLTKGDSSKLDVTLTQWEGVNRLLLASASAQQELTKSASPDWDKIGDGIAKVAGIGVKIALAVAGV